MSPRPTALPKTPPLGQTTFYRNPAVRQAYVVYGVGEEFVIRETAPSPGTPAERRFPRAAVEGIAWHYAGRVVTVKRVLDDVRFGMIDVDLSGSGPMLSYAVKDVLLILAAMGICRVDASSAEHEYAVQPLRESTH